jgi:putative flippase GtrA
MARRNWKELLRTAGAGTLGGAVDLLILALLVELAGVAPGLATIASAGVGALVNFFLTRSWAFRSRGPIVRQGGMYAIATAVWVGLSAIVVQLVVGFVRAPYLAARIVADVVVFLGWGYPSSRWIFGARRRSLAR